LTRSLVPGSFAAVSVQNPFSILFVTGNRIGDSVLSSGVLAQLIDQHPGASVTIACGALAAPLFADVPGLDRILILVKKRRHGHWVDLWSKTAFRRWDVVVDLRGAIFAWTVPAKRRMVARAEKRREHRVAELGRMLGLAAPPAPRLWISPHRLHRAESLLGSGPPVLAIAPAANWGGKQWPADRFAEIARRLTSESGILPGARIAVLAAASERDTATPVLAAVPKDRVIDLVGAPDLLDVFAILTRSAFFLGNDSGLMHLAAAAGIPTLGLFGPSPEWRYGPWGERTAIARTPESYDEHMASPAYDYKSQATMMGNLSVETVADAARELWRRARPAAGL
jgi:ADP-heptose:LPS heptosyltransferase